MKKLSFTVLLFSTFSFLFIACKKEVQRIDPQFIKAIAFWKDNGPNHQKFSVNAATGGTIIGAKGTKLSIPPGAFVDAGGAIITEMVSLNLVEIPTKRDIIFSGVLTEANEQLLVSGGEFLVEAKKQNGDALQLNPQLGLPGGQGVRMEVPAVQGADAAMKLFVRAERQQQGGQNNDNPMTWIPAPYAPFGSGTNSYVFNLPEFNWVNIDKFYSDPRPKTTITALPDFKDNKNVSKLEVLLIFKDVNTVCPIPYNHGKQKFESYHDAVPVGSEVIIAIVGEDADGYVQFGYTDIVVVAGMHIDVQVKKTSKATMDSFLASIQ